MRKFRGRSDRLEKSDWFRRAVDKLKISSEKKNTEAEATSSEPNCHR